jgi:hypothetical protein
MLDPSKLNMKQAWNALVEARKGNTISQAIYRKWCDVAAMPYDTDPECASIKSYDDFNKHHTRVWFID